MWSCLQDPGICSSHRIDLYETWKLIHGIRGDLEAIFLIHVTSIVFLLFGQNSGCLFLY